jgi:large subunit ribosomal protein L10
MAISRDKKHELVAEFAGLLANAKMTVFASYGGVNVQDLQVLRRMAREAGVTIKVVKNRLVRVALGETQAYKNTTTDALSGQLLYAISDSDEVAPAQVLAKFAKDNPALALVGGISGEGANLSTDEVKALAALPNKPVLIAEVVAQLLSPVHDVTNALAGNLHGLLDGIEAKATA